MLIVEWWGWAVGWCGKKEKNRKRRQPSSGSIWSQRAHKEFVGQWIKIFLKYPIIFHIALSITTKTVGKRRNEKSFFFAKNCTFAHHHCITFHISNQPLHYLLTSSPYYQRKPFILNLYSPPDKKEKRQKNTTENKQHNTIISNTTSAVTICYTRLRPSFISIPHSHKTGLVCVSWFESTTKATLSTTTTNPHKQQQ